PPPPHGRSRGCSPGRHRRSEVTERARSPSRRGAPRPGGAPSRSPERASLVLHPDGAADAASVVAGVVLLEGGGAFELVEQTLIELAARIRRGGRLLGRGIAILLLTRIRGLALLLGRSVLRRVVSGLLGSIGRRVGSLVLLLLVLALILGVRVVAFVLLL